MLPGYIWGVSGECLVGVWGYMTGIQGHRRRSDVFGGIWLLSPCSMEPKHYFGTTWKEQFFLSSDLTETSKYQNVHMSAQQKWLGFAIFLFFKACQIEIIIHSCH